MSNQRHHEPQQTQTAAFSADAVPSFAAAEDALEAAARQAHSGVPGAQFSGGPARAASRPLAESAAGPRNGALVVRGGDSPLPRALRARAGWRQWRAARASPTRDCALACVGKRVALAARPVAASPGRDPPLRAALM